MMRLATVEGIVLKNESFRLVRMPIIYLKMHCILGMHKAIDQLDKTTFIAVDGNRFKPFGDIPYKTIIKGDAKYLNIAAASVLAKTYRDDYMATIHEEFPMYNWKQNKGYPTKEHRKSLQKYGATKYHRKSFKLLPDQLRFEF